MYQEEEIKNMFENAYDEKFTKQKEIVSSSPTKSPKRNNKEASVKFSEDVKKRNSRRSSKGNSQNSFTKVTDEPQEMDIPSPVQVRRDKKVSQGPYQKGNWRSLNIKSIIPASVLNSSDTGK